MSTQKYKFGDYLDLIKDIPDNSIDLIVTDPPYNVLQLEWDKKEINLKILAEQLYRIVRFSGTIYICCQMPFGFNVYNYFTETGLKFIQDLVWVKNRGFSLNKTTFTKYHENILFFEKSPKNEILKFGEYVKQNRIEKDLTTRQCREMCDLKVYENCGNAGYLWYETGAVPTVETYKKIKNILHLDNRFDFLFMKKIFNFDDIKTIGEKYTYIKKPEHKLYGKHKTQNTFKGINQGYRNPKTTMFHNVIQSGDEYIGHPTQKPLKMFEHLIAASSNENDIVLDPFLGSGTTLESCARLNRNCIGFEISDEWESNYKPRIEKGKQFYNTSNNIITRPFMSYFKK